MIVGHNLGICYTLGGHWIWTVWILNRLDPRRISTLLNWDFCKSKPQLSFFPLAEVQRSAVPGWELAGLLFFTHLINTALDGRVGLTCRRCGWMKPDPFRKRVGCGLCPNHGFHLLTWPDPTRPTCHPYSKPILETTKMPLTLSEWLNTK